MFLTGGGNNDLNEMFGGARPKLSSSEKRLRKEAKDAKRKKEAALKKQAKVAAK
jgi:hypothetical protein